MKNRITPLLLALVALLAGCKKSGNELLTLEKLQIEAEAVRPERGNHLYPSWLYLASGLSVVYQQAGLKEEIIEITLVNPGIGTRIGLQMPETELTLPSRFELVAGDEQQIRLNYPVIWNHKKLLAWKKEAPVDLRWEVTIDEAYVGMYNKSFRVHSINECITGIQTATSIRSTKATYAAYIEEDHSELGTLIREAVSLGIVPMFGDYQRGIEFVQYQLLAIWNALENRGIKTLRANETAGEKTKTIHSLSHVLENKGGSPEEVALLFSSLCQQLGFCTTLHTRPNGIYIGIADNFYNQHPSLVYFLDPTQMNHTPGESKTRFEEALQSGRRMYEQDRQASQATPANYEEIWIDPTRLHIPSLSLSQQ